MITTTTLQEELKQATYRSHQALEKKLVKAIHRIKSQKDYVKFLKVMYGYYAALERQMDRYLPYMQIAHRRTAYRLLNDINRMEPTDKIDLCKDLPSIDSLTSALGAMYVVEGSVMGAPHVTKMLASQVKLDDNTTSTFFDLPAHEIAASWNTFLSNFYRDFEEDERRSIIRGAETTFATFSNWIDQKAS